MGIKVWQFLTAKETGLTQGSQILGGAIHSSSYYCVQNQSVY